MVYTAATQPEINKTNQNRLIRLFLSFLTLLVARESPEKSRLYFRKIVRSWTEM